MNLSQTVIIDNIPVALREMKCWTTWGSNNKTPKMPDPPVGSDGLTFKAAMAKKHGVGIFLGDGLCGIDLDGCRDPETGVVAEWATVIVEAFGSYTEISPSATGLKIFCLGAPVLERKQRMVGGEVGGKKSAVEAYTEGRYFTVTGNVYEKYLELVAPDEAVWLRLNNYLSEKSGEKKSKRGAKGDGKRLKKGERNNQLFTMAISMRKKDFPYDDVLTALKSINATSLENPLDEEEVIGICNNAFKSHAEIPWLFGKGGDILPCQENIILGLEMLGVSLRYDQFRDRKLIVMKGSKEKTLDDADIQELWLEIEKKWRFRAAKDYFWSLVDWMARKETVHPVQDMLSGLEWDGKKRLEGWLAEYGGGEAKSEEYLKWISRGVMVAAVKRIYEPGCVFQEMMVIEGDQGCGKSLALKALAMRDEWFSDDLPLGAEAKIVIERTLGKWIIEAAELTESKGNQIENLKAFLSRCSERARLAWGREPVDRFRHFIPIGTTNDDAYLKDITGDRRFWPLKVKKFDLKALHGVREQLWAEAVTCWKDGFDVRMPEKLWPFAEQEQASRKMLLAWMEDLEETLSGKKGWFPASDLREWFMSRRWNDYVAYPQVTKYLRIKMGFNNELKKVGTAAIKIWWKGSRVDRLDFYKKDSM